MAEYNLSTKKTPEQIKINSLEVDRYEPAPDGIHVEHVGMISGMDAFTALEDHLKENGLFPDEYFAPSSETKKMAELPDYHTAICHTDWGGSEGIYLDIYLKTEDGLLRFATGKTLGESGDDFLKMSRIGAECSMMLNGRGCSIKFSKEAYDFNGKEAETEIERLKEDLEKSKTVNLNAGRIVGQKEAWELARKIINMPLEDRRKMWGTEGHNPRMEEIFTDTYREAAEKVAEWEKQREAIGSEPEITETEGDFDFEGKTNLSAIDRAKALIDDFCFSEHGESANFDNLQEIGIAYTTVTDDEIPTQINVNLMDFCLERYLNDVLVDKRQYDSLESLIRNELEYLDFNILVSYSEEDIAVALGEEFEIE